MADQDIFISKRGEVSWRKEMRLFEGETEKERESLKLWEGERQHSLDRCQQMTNNAKRETTCLRTKYAAICRDHDSRPQKQR
jgi:hypothetical protein